MSSCCLSFQFSGYFINFNCVVGVGECRLTGGGLLRWQGGGSVSWACILEESRRVFIMR